MRERVKEVRERGERRSKKSEERMGAKIHGYLSALRDIFLSLGRIFRAFTVRDGLPLGEERTEKQHTREDKQKK